ncbi:hypothetical protein Hanom_Chr00s000004g01606911 [Helianthus anomalus]
MKVYPKSSIIWTSISISRHPKSWNNCLQPNQRQICVAQFLSTFEHSTLWKEEENLLAEQQWEPRCETASKRCDGRIIYILDATVTQGDVGGKLRG